jgi:8-oxo-dGTP pyrophosphatase MutT (NUDIX family)
MEITRHFTATVLLVYQDRVLLHRHKKRGILLPLGGHLERHELPEEAALRLKLAPLARKELIKPSG